MKRKSLITGAIFLLGFLTVQICNAQKQVERWGRFEVKLNHAPTGNAFVDDSLYAVFSNGDIKIFVHGFYDGEGIYKVRFMPAETGNWTYETGSNVSELNGVSGSFTCIEATGNNHGPVKVRNQYHFAYSDGKPYYPFGTTCYSFIHQSDSQAAVALNQLKHSPFNKIRFCVFPQWQDYTAVYPPYFPFERTGKEGKPIESGYWDLKRFNPDFFRNLEKRIEDLSKQGVEADIILFHPYDEGHWGFDKMDRETDIFYLKYIVARLSSFHNVWWSLANEYDFLKAKDQDDWDALISTVAAEDPFRHLCSIHNGKKYFENWNPNITHASIQSGDLVNDFGKAVILRDAYKKPVIYDEVCYEGDIVPRWGNISGEELTHRMWQGMIAGTYVGHGETFVGSDSILHLIYGRELRGKCPARIQFLRDIVEETGALEAVDHFWGANNVAISEKGDVLIYFGKNKISKWPFTITRDSKIPDGTRYKAEIIDTWNMTRTPVSQTFETILKEGVILDVNNKVIKMPKKQYLAIRLIRL